MKPICPGCAKPAERRGCRDEKCGYEANDPYYPLQTLDELLGDGPPAPANDVDLRAFARAVRGYVLSRRNRFAAMTWDAEWTTRATKPKRARKR